MMHSTGHRYLVDFLDPLELGERNGVDDGILADSREGDDVFAPNYPSGVPQTGEEWVMESDKEDGVRNQRLK